jgi:TubC N-terminal docking domain
MNATKLITELEARGVLIEATGGRLRVDAPKGAITPELCEALAACKAEVLAILNAPEDEIEWRIEAMLSQIPNVGPIPFLVAKPMEAIEPNCCHSCSGYLNGTKGYVCGPCSQAKHRALEIAFSNQLAIKRGHHDCDQTKKDTTTCQ